MNKKIKEKISEGSEGFLGRAAFRKWKQARTNNQTKEWKEREKKIKDGSLDGSKIKRQRHYIEEKTP